MIDVRITKIIFWIAFTAFLSASIPHVAWLFHYYEADNMQAIGWIISYLIASGIDILIMWLSYIQSKGNLHDIRVTWLFIALLSCLSWYANWIYDMAHNPSYHGNVWSINVYNGVTLGVITPVIVSAIPIFILAYTYMLSRISNASITPDEYAKRAKELEAILAQRATIAQLKRQARNGNISNLISDIATFGNQIKAALPAPSHTPELVKLQSTGEIDMSSSENRNNHTVTPDILNTDVTDVVPITDAIQAISVTAPLQTASVTAPSQPTHDIMSFLATISE